MLMAWLVAALRSRAGLELPLPVFDQLVSM